MSDAVPPSITRLAIFASGSGTVAQALLDASARDELSGGKVLVVVADRPGAGVLERGAKAGVETIVVPPSDYGDRAVWGKALVIQMEARGIGLVCSAGLMKLLPPNFVSKFSNRILNTHPALLPSFPGTHSVKDALEWGAKVTGSTIHFVDEAADHGPILMQRAVEVLPADDEAGLHERIKAEERRMYPEAVRAVVEGRVRIEGRVVRIIEPGVKT